MPTPNSCQIITDEHASDDRFSGREYIRVMVIAEDREYRLATVTLLRLSYNKLGHEVTAMENGETVKYEGTQHYKHVVITHQAHLLPDVVPAGNAPPFNKAFKLHGQMLITAVMESYIDSPLPNNLYMTADATTEAPDGSTVATSLSSVHWKGSFKATLDAMARDADKEHKCVFIHSICAPNNGVCRIRYANHALNPVYDELRKARIPRMVMRQDSKSVWTFEPDGLRQLAEPIIRRLKAEEATTKEPAEAALARRDYEEAQKDVDRLVRELDVALNGLTGAAPQARLCDLVSQVKDGRWALSKAGSAYPVTIRTGWLHNATQVLCAIETDGGTILIAHPDAPPKAEGMAMHWRPSANLPEWIRKGRLC